jgi:hypothetical protein
LKWQSTFAPLQADRQEALVKAEQRRMAIERANKMLFDDTDDVKALHGKLQLSEVSTYYCSCVQDGSDSSVASSM